MTTKLKSSAGVTMVELLIMTVIFGVVASMAIPRFRQGYEGLQFRSANRDIVSTLRLARSMSIADKMQYGVYIDYETHTMTLFQDMTSLDLYVFEDSDRQVRVDSLGTDVEYIFTDMTNNTITFGPNGSAGFVGGGNILVMRYTENASYESFHNILRSTGRVKSYDDWEEWAEAHISAL